MDRGYPKDSAVRFISNHHRLADEERFILMRVIVKSDVARIRRSRMQKLEDLKDQVIFIDGYNVLITTESVLGGHPVYSCDDGFLRDSRGIFRSYKILPRSPLLPSTRSLISCPRPVPPEQRCCWTSR